MPRLCRGLNEFDEAKCAYLASIGYVALAIDVYGEAFPFDLRTNNAKFDPATASEHRHGAFAAMNSMLSDWAKFRRFLRAWVTAGKSHSAACPDRCGAIGYCFGGCAVLEMVRDGIPGVQGVVSFHGVLSSYPQALPDTPAPPMVSTPSNSYANKDIIVYIENGADDHLVPDEAIRGFKDEMAAQGINWKFADYADWSARPPLVYGAERQQRAASCLVVRSHSCSHSCLAVHPALEAAAV